MKARDKNTPHLDQAEIVEVLNVPVYWKNGGSCFSGCNQKFADMFGLKKEQIIGKTANELFPPNIAELFAKDEADVSALGCVTVPARVLSCVDPKTGLPHWYRFSKTQLTSGGLACSCEDITENKNNEAAIQLRDKQLKHASEEVQKANNAKTEFLSRISHEIRTPMNAVLGMTYIAKNSSDPAKIKYCLEKIDQSGKQLLGIINDILDMSKIESDKLELSCEEFNLEKLLSEIVNLVNARLAEKNQTLNPKLSSDLPAWFKGDALRLSQVLTNLLSNAIKFSPENSEIKLTAQVISKDAANTELRFTVQDYGIGMSPEAQAKLFTPFEQGGGIALSRQFGGTGLGLAICKRIVNLMGGEIGVKSELGRGSTFSFTVILKNVEHKHCGLAANPKDIRVLAVDDSEDMLIFYSSVFADYGIPCDTALSGGQALVMMEAAAKEKKPYNIIFTDWRMPGMDGVETAKAIKSKYKCEIVLVSIAERSIIEGSARDSGIFKFLPKPLFASSIVSTVNEILGVADAYKYPEPTEKENIIMSEVNDFKQFMPYVDVDDGLNRVRGNKKLYARLLKTYIPGADTQGIAALLERKAFEDAQHAVHTLKGVSANLSVKRAFELSLALETCLKEGRETSQAFFELKKCIEITLPIIQQLIPLLEV